MKTLLILAGVAVMATAMPAQARHHHSRKTTVCTKVRHGQCVQWDRMSRAKAHRYDVGYRFGPRYGYTTYDSLPRSYRSRYSLSPDYRYVYSGNTIYVVDPKTYAVQRVIDAIVH